MAFLWLRQWVRRNLRPVHPERARKVTSVLSAVYFLTAWQLLAYAVYMIVRDEDTDIEKGKNKSEYYANLVGSGKTTIIQMDGFSVKEKYMYSARETVERGKSNEERRREERARMKEERKKQRLKEKEKKARELARKQDPNSIYYEPNMEVDQPVQSL